VNISGVWKWDNSTQNWGSIWGYKLGNWKGVDFDIAPGDGVALIVKVSEFEWVPVLITPAV